MQNTNIQQFQTWATSSIELTDGQSNVQLDTLATLLNVTLSIEFYNNGEPVTSGISGVLAVAKQWQNGRIQTPVQHQLSTTNTNLKKQK